MAKAYGIEWSVKRLIMRPLTFSSAFARCLLTQPMYRSTWPRRDVKYPGELLVYGQIASQIIALLGADRAHYEQIIQGVAAPGVFRGDTYVGSACKPHACMDEGAILVADIQRQRVFLAWKPEGKSIVVRPKVNEWPAIARDALSEWAERWKPGR